jgi:hypothetical protein
MKPGRSVNHGDGTGAFPRLDMTRNGRGLGDHGDQGIKGIAGITGTWEIQYSTRTAVQRDPLWAAAILRDGRPGEAVDWGLAGPIASIRADDRLIEEDLRETVRACALPLALSPLWGPCILVPLYGVMGVPQIRWLYTPYSVLCPQKPLASSSYSRPAKKPSSPPGNQGIRGSLSEQVHAIVIGFQTEARTGAETRSTVRRLTPVHVYALHVMAQAL